MTFIFVSENVMALLKEEADNIGKSVSDLANLIIEDWLIRNRKPVPKCGKEQEK